MATKAKSTPNTRDVLLSQHWKVNYADMYWSCLIWRFKPIMSMMSVSATYPWFSAGAKSAGLEVQGFSVERRVQRGMQTHAAAERTENSIRGKQGMKGSSKTSHFPLGWAFRIHVIAEVKGLLSREMTAEFINCWVICVCDCNFVSV